MSRDKLFGMNYVIDSTMPDDMVIMRTEQSEIIIRFRQNVVIAMDQAFRTAHRALHGMATWEYSDRAKSHRTHL